MSLFRKEIETVEDLKLILNELNPQMEAFICGTNGYVFIDMEDKLITFDYDENVFCCEKPLISLDGDYDVEDQDLYELIEDYTPEKAKQLFIDEASKI